MSRVTQDRKITYLVDHLEYQLSKINPSEVDYNSYGRPQVYTTFPLSQNLSNSTASPVELTNLIVNELAGLTTCIDTKSKELWWAVKDNLNLEHPTTKNIFSALLNAIKENKYLDHLMFAVLSNSISFLVENKINEIPKCLEFVKTKFGLLPKRPEYLVWNGSGHIEVTRSKPTRFQYTYPSDDHFFDDSLTKNAHIIMCTGPELEGGFPSNDDALAFVIEAQAEGLLTKTNEFVPTHDGSIHRVACAVEWNLAPAEFNAARINWLRRFQDLLKKHHWKSSTEETGSGLHIHIDRRICSTDQWKLVCKVFAQLSADTKANFFGRDARKTVDGRAGDYWCSWDSTRWYKSKEELVPYRLDQDGEQLWKKGEYLYAPDGQTYKYVLWNFQHKHTVECRGFNSNADLVKAHLGLYFVITSVKSGKPIDWIINKFTELYGKIN